MPKESAEPFGTAQICPLGVDLWGNYPDGSIYMYSLRWDEVAALAKRRGKRIAGKGGIEQLVGKLGDVLSATPRAALADWLLKPAPVLKPTPEPPLLPWDHNIDTR